MDVNSLDQQLSSLFSRLKKLNQSHSTILGILQAKRAELRKLMDETIALGYDPNNLDKEIKKLFEVLSLKIQNFEAEISKAEELLNPMLKEVNG